LILDVVKNVGCYSADAAGGMFDVFIETLNSSQCANAEQIYPVQCNPQKNNGLSSSTVMTNELCLEICLNYNYTYSGTLQ